MIRIGILGSGRGSNCRAILRSIRDGKLNTKATVVISDVLDAPILEIAREFGVANAYLPPGHFRTRLEPKVEAQLVKMLQDAEVVVVVLAGFMRVLKEQMLAAFPRRIVNIHPSLLPKFPGLEAWKQALMANEKWSETNPTLKSAIQKCVSWENDLKALGLGPTAEQFLHCKKERLVLVKDGVDLIDDRRIHAEATGAFKRALGRRYSFRHHLHIDLDLGQHFGVAQPFTHSPIAAVFAVPGRDQIAHGAESVQC